MNLIIKAASFAARLHKDQLRNNSGKPYLSHLIRVAGRTATRPGMTEDDVAAAFLHDGLEDCCPTEEDRNILIQEIISELGMPVLEIVVALTNPSKGSQAPRAERKEMDRMHLACCPVNVKRIKLIDHIDNLTEFLDDSLAGRGSSLKFLELYAKESQQLLDQSLHGADPELELELNTAIKALLDHVDCRLEEKGVGA